MLFLFRSSTCFEQSCAHPQEDNCINTASGIITLSWCLVGMHVEREVQFSVDGAVRLAQFSADGAVRLAEHHLH